jgi:O-antigen/teichoic acid export membrane protein
MFKQLKLNASPFLKDVFLTTLTSFVVMLCMVLTISILARSLGPELFGAYSLARRFVGFMFPLTTFGLGVTLTRYLAFSINDESRKNYFHAAIIIYIVVSLFSVLLGIIFHRSLTVIIFRDVVYTKLYYLSLFMLVGVSFYTLLYSYYRGTNRMRMANIWNALVVGILPLLISLFLMYRGNLEMIFLLMGLAYYLTIGPIVLAYRKMKLSFLQIHKNKIKEMLHYSTPRIPGQVFFAGLLAIGPFCASYFGSIRDVGLIVIGQSILRVMQFSVSGFGFVALPKISEISAKGNKIVLEARINDVLEMVFHCSLFLVVQCFIWSDEIVLLWLGNKYANAVPIIQIFILSLCPYLLYVLLRSVIDAVEVKAYNTLNTFVSLVIAFFVTVILEYSGWGILGIAIGSSAGFASLGVLTVLFISKRFNLTILNLHNMLAIIINVIFTVLVLCLKAYLLPNAQFIHVLFVMLISSTICFVFYFYVLSRVRVGWLKELKKRLIR